MFRWSSNASNAALAGGIGSKALPLTSDQEKDVLALASSFGDPKEDQRSMAFLQGGGSSDMEDVEAGEPEKLASTPTDVKAKFSILLNDSYETGSEKATSDAGVQSSRNPATHHPIAVQAQASPDATHFDSQEIVRCLVNTLNWDELEELLGLVWVPPRQEANGDVSTRRGQIVKLERQHVALSCKNLVEKLKMVLSYNNDTSAPKDSAADLIAWILQEGVSLNFEPSALANDMLVFSQSSCMPVSRAGLRALRNLVVQSVTDYREVVLKHPHFAKLFTRTDAESYIYVCEMISHIAKSAESEAACTEFFHTVCDLAIDPVVGILALYDTWPANMGTLRWTLIALITLRSPKLIDTFANDLGKLDIVWKFIDREESQGAHELAMELLAGLVSSGDEKVLHRSLQHISELFDILGVGNDFHLELNALRVARSIQERQKEKFGEQMGLDQLTKVHLLLRNGACEHQNVCLGVVLDLLVVDHPMLFSPLGPNLVRPVIDLLGSDSVDVLTTCIEVVRSMIEKNSKAVRDEAHDGSGSMLVHLVALLQLDDFRACNDVYSILTWYGQTKGQEEEELGEAVVHALVTNLVSHAVDRRVILPSIIAVLHESRSSCEEAVKAGLLGYLTEALSDGRCPEIGSIAKVLHCLLVDTDAAVDEVHAKHPTLVHALVDHIKTTGSGEDAPLVLVSLLVGSLVAVLVTSPHRDDFATPESLQLLSNLLASGNTDQEAGAIELLDASIAWFQLPAVEESKVLIPLCTLLPKYVDKSNGQQLAQAIMHVLGYVGQTEAAMVADVIMKLREEVANKAWEAGLGMTGADPAVVNGTMKVFHELRQRENKFFKDNANNLSVVHLEHQAEALTQKCQVLLAENQALVDENQELERRNGEFCEENHQLHESVARSSAQAEMAVVMGNQEVENGLRTEIDTLKGEVAHMQQCIDDLEKDKAGLEEGARVMRDAMEQQHDWIQTLQVAIDGTGVMVDRNAAQGQ